MTVQRDYKVQQIDALLPQTQCGKCGFDGCRPYAKAISTGEPINQCPPGGPNTIENLARLLDQPVQALNPVHGEYGPPMVATIREAECIGCTKCIQACPLDAILGAAKVMHTVFESQCSGCDLCVLPCPVDCIDMIAASLPAQPELWRQRYQNRQQRLAASNLAGSHTHNQSADDNGNSVDANSETVSPPSKRPVLSAQTAQQDIAAAVARVKAKQAKRSETNNHYQTKKK